jgi:DNA polymerase
MIVGQDWGDVRYFTKHQGVEGPGNPTNEALRELIGLLGIDVGPPGDSRRSGVAFFTNAVLCLKDGGLQSKVRRKWFVNCASFLRQQVEIVSPKLVICLGERAYRSLAATFGFRAGEFRTAVDSPEGVLLSNGTRAFARYHCGRRIQNTHRPLELQRQDWLRLNQFL